MRFASPRHETVHRFVRARRGFTKGVLAVIVFPVLTVATSTFPVRAGESVLHCGVDILLEEDFGAIPPEGLRWMDAAERGKKATSINLEAGSGLLANPDALNAWQNAVAKWESILQDAVTITIDGDLAPLGSGVLGSTSSRSFYTAYATVRDAVVADRSADESFIAQMPTAAEFDAEVPPGMSTSGNLSATKANLRALGFDMSFDDPNPDATITFSTGFADDFDYDPTDGITPGMFDFEGIVLHEIGHVLGFVSEVDYADWLRDSGFTDALTPSTLDLFRTAPGAGHANFTTATRTITTGDLRSVQTTYDGNGDLIMSTGRALGDGRQASHWKANELSGTYIGAMDPTLARGELTVVTNNDKRAFGIIGWDVVVGPVVDCNDNGIEDAEDIATGTSQDCNGNAVPDECDVADGTSLDCNGNGVPDDCDISGGTSSDSNTNGVPDECEATSADAGPWRFGYRVEAYPNPFNPSTTIHYELPTAQHVQMLVYDVTGRLVRTLLRGEVAAGPHSVTWQGRDDRGARVASGVYFLTVRTGERSLRRKLSLVK